MADDSRPISNNVAQKWSTDVKPISPLVSLYACALFLSIRPGTEAVLGMLLMQ